MGQKPRRGSSTVELQHQDGAVVFQGTRGSLTIHRRDEIGWKLAMLIEGRCTGKTVAVVAPLYGYSKQRYHQVLAGFRERGSAALLSRKRGPKAPSRRTPEVTRQIIRHRFLDPDASPEVIAQKLKQSNLPISRRSVFRVFEQFGLQKRGSTSAGRGAGTGRRR